MKFLTTGIQNEVVKVVHQDSSIFCTVTLPVCLSLVQTHSVLNKELYSSLLHITAYAQQSRKANVITYETGELKDLVGVTHPQTSYLNAWKKRHMQFFAFYKNVYLIYCG